MTTTRAAPGAARVVVIIEVIVMSGTLPPPAEPEHDVAGAFIVDGEIRVAVDAAPRNPLASAFVHRAALRN